jgi:hypothetical protein
MSNLDDNQIHHRLERLSQVEPTQEATDRVKQRVRDTLTKQQEGRHNVGARILRAVFKSPLPKLAAAAVLLIGFGYVGGRLSAPEPLNIGALQASLRSSIEPAIRRELLDEMENRLQLAVAADRDTLKRELHQQVAHDLETFADQTLTAVGNLTDQRFMEFARMVEEARIKDRQRVAAALDYMGSRFGDGLVTLAAHTNERQHLEQN